MSLDRPPTEVDTATDSVEMILAQIRADPQNPLAWELFYNHYRRLVAGVLYRFGTREDLSDLSQEVFRRFLEASQWSDDWRTLPRAAIVSAYLRQTARRVVVDEWRKRSRRRTDTVGSTTELERFQVATNRTQDGNETEDRIFRSRMLGKIVHELADEDKALLRLVLRGTPLRAIAFEFDISYSAAGTRVSRLKERLRNIVRGIG